MREVYIERRTTTPPGLPRRHHMFYAVILSEAQNLRISLLHLLLPLLSPLLLPLGLAWGFRSTNNATIKGTLAPDSPNLQAPRCSRIFHNACRKIPIQTSASVPETPNRITSRLTCSPSLFAGCRRT